jgi:ABC-type multidrug transport system fused ATPase/permease subunit
MLVIIVFSAICVFFRGFNFNVISERISFWLRYDIFYFVINKDIGFFDENKTGEIMSRISSDTAVVQNGLGTNISMFVRALIEIICTLIILCLISWKLTMVTLGGILPISMIASIYGRRIRKYTK